jgi:hypothetical protein
MLPLRTPMKASTLACTLSLLLSGVAQAQVARVAQPVPQTPQVKSEAELARAKVAPPTELQRLQNERKKACDGKANAADCVKKAPVANAAKPALDSKVQAISKHEADARAGRLLKAVPGKAAVRVPAGNNNCGGCHAGGGTAPANDPVVAPPGTGMPGIIPNVGPGTAPAADPVAAGPGSGGAQQGGGGPRVMPPATAARCFIASAAFGSGDAEEVRVLRHFRDTQLIGHPLGDWFVRSYYRVSPPIADAIAERPALRAVVRSTLLVVVFALREPVSFLSWLVAGLVAVLLWRCWRRAVVAPGLAPRLRLHTARP